MSDSDQPIGLLNVYALEEDAFDEEGDKLLDGMAQGVAVALRSYQHRRVRSAAILGQGLRRDLDQPGVTELARCRTRATARRSRANTRISPRWVNVLGGCLPCPGAR